jgi:acetyl-CoA acetyltransferase
VQGSAPGHYRIPDLFAWHAKHGSDWNSHQAERLWRQAGLGPQDVDAAMVFDHFTPAVVMTLQDWGFCARGDAGPFVEDGGTRWPAGRLPVNTHGGSTSEASIHGFNHWPEAVRQIRGTAVNQVADCSVVFVNGAMTDPSGAVVLTR